MIEGKFYKLIITDIMMPVMDGIALYKEAVAKFPTLNTRFLFMTGDLSPERQSYFDEYRLKVLAKPMNIKVLKEEAAEIILSQ